MRHGLHLNTQDFKKDNCEILHQRGADLSTANSAVIRTNDQALRAQVCPITAVGEALERLADQVAKN